MASPRLGAPKHSSQTCANQTPGLALSPDTDLEDLPEHLRPNRKPGDPNPDDEARRFMHEFLKTTNPAEETRLPPDELIDRTFLMPPKADVSRCRAKIISRIDDCKKRNGLNSHPEIVKFKCLMNGDYEEVIAI